MKRDHSYTLRSRAYTFTMHIISIHVHTVGIGITHALLSKQYNVRVLLEADRNKHSPPPLCSRGTNELFLASLSAAHSACVLFFLRARLAYMGICAFASHLRYKMISFVLLNASMLERAAGVLKEKKKSTYLSWKEAPCRERGLIYSVDRSKGPSTGNAYLCALFSYCCNFFFTFLF